MVGVICILFLLLHMYVEQKKIEKNNVPSVANHNFFCLFIIEHYEGEKD